MSLKIVLVLCAIVALHSVANAHPEYTPEGRNLLENVQAAIHKVEEKAKEFIESAREKLYGIFDDFNTLAHRIIGNTETQINGVVNQFLLEINQLKSEAQALGIDVSDCVGQQEETLKGLAPKIIGELRACIEGILEQAMKIVTETVEEFKSVFTQVGDLKDRFVGCGTGVSSITCLSKVLGDATAIGVKFPLTVTGQVAKATTLVASLQTELTVCATSKVAQITTEAATAAYDITKCIRDKIQAHN